MKQPSLFEGDRLTLEDSIALTISSLATYGQRYRHWTIAFSGGKDSSTTLTLVLWLLATGQLAKPETMTIQYSDTRMELPPLYLAAMSLLRTAERHGWRVQVTTPPLEERFFVRMLGWGYPPPHNGFRWCVGLLKIEPMQRGLAALREQVGEKFLTLTGMRLGESAARDARITLSCSRDDGECSQGWYQRTTPAHVADILAPIVHWRVCHVADWLTFFAPKYGFDTAPVIEAYDAGSGDTEDLTARTGCMECPVAGNDTVMSRIVSLPHWAYMAPFRRLKELYAVLSAPQSRLRKNGERLKDGSLSKRPQRLGPLTMEARRWGLAQIKALQDEVNTQAQKEGRPEYWLITPEEEAKILELIDQGKWPEKWDGTEVRGDELIPLILAEDVVQPLLLQM